MLRWPRKVLLRRGLRQPNAAIALPHTAKARLRVTPRGQSAATCAQDPTAFFFYSVLMRMHSIVLVELCTGFGM